MKGSRFILPSIISFGALGAAAIHALRPEFTVDAFTTAMLILAAIPWLAPMLKTLQLPGGWKVEFQELKRGVEDEIQRGHARVAKLETRVHEVEQFAFSGAVDERQKESLNNSLAGFHAYLRGLGFPLDEELPSIHVAGEEYSNAHYEPVTRQIVLGKAFTADPDVIFREYTHHALLACHSGSVPSGDPWEQIESGLADYFPCSYADDPILGERVATVLRKEHPDLDRGFIRNLRNDRRFTEIKRNTSFQDAGEVWGGAFWDIRKKLGHAVADKLLFAAWMAATPSKRARKDFLAVLTQDTETSEAVGNVFQDRGLSIRG